MMKSTTERRTVKIRRLEDGLVIERHGIDARGMVAAGTHEFVSLETPSLYERVSRLTTEAMRDLLVWPQTLQARPPDRETAIRELVRKVEAGELELPE